MGTAIVAIVTVGISGSGKSSWVKQFVKANPDYIVICPDDIRRELTGNISDQSQNRDVWRIAYWRFDRYMHEGSNVIFDSTACNKKTLLSILNIISQHAFLIDIEIFDVDPSVAKERVHSDITNGIDRSQVPDSIIDRQYQGFQEVLSEIQGLHLKEPNVVHYHTTRKDY